MDNASQEFLLFPRPDPVVSSGALLNTTEKVQGWRTSLHIAGRCRSICEKIVTIVTTVIVASENKVEAGQDQRVAQGREEFAVPRHFWEGKEALVDLPYPPACMGGFGDGGDDGDDLFLMFAGLLPTVTVRTPPC